MSDDMPKESDRFSELAAQIDSPEVVAKIDAAMADVRQELLELEAIRRIAVRRERGEPITRLPSYKGSDTWAPNENGTIYPRHKPWLKL